VNVCVALGAVTFVLNAAVLCWQVTQLTTTPPTTPTTRDDATLPAARDEALFAYVNWLDPRFDAVTLQTTSLRADVVDGGGGRRRRVCIVAWEYEDVVVHGGGIGTAFTALARSLAHAGHEVTVLVNRADPVDYTAMLTAGWDEWRALILQRDNVTLFEPEGGIASLDKARDRCGFACVWSYVAFRWLAARDGQFDIVHFHDNAAFGYYSILARQQKQHFANTLLVVGAHGPHFWERKANRVYLTDTYNLEADYMERYMARWCDYLIAPSQFIVDWMWRNDWQLSPARVRVWQNIMPVSKLVLERRLVRSRAVMNNTAFYAGPDPKRDAALALDDAELPSGCATAECAQAHAIRPRATKRIVFFGRHETRKGLGVFIDAVRLINATLLAHGIALVFLGSQSIVQGRSSDEFIYQHCLDAQLTCEQLTDLGRTAAHEQLTMPDTLTVVASLTENSPYTVLECLGKPLPFIASRVGGIPELVAAEDRDRTLFEPTARALADRLLHVIEHGLVPARYAVTPAETERVWVDWHASVPIRPAAFATDVSAGGSSLPPVVLCVAHRNSAALLGETLDAAFAEAARYGGDTLIVLADAGSDDAAAQAAVDAFAQRQGARTLLLRLPATTAVGEARNQCVAAAKESKYVVFVDAGDAIGATALATMVDLAERRNLSVLSAPARLVRPRTEEIELYTGCGEHGDGMALYHNCYGSTAALIRRDAFLRAGGFRRDEFGVDDSTHALFASILLRGGGRLETCACAVLFTRRWTGADAEQPRFGDVPDEFVRRSRQVRPFLGALPPSMRAVGAFAVDMYQTMREIEAKKKRWYAERFARVENALTLLREFYDLHKSSD
jgi:O-antigen biosynthesis protein